MVNLYRLYGKWNFLEQKWYLSFILKITFTLWNVQQYIIISQGKLKQKRYETDHKKFTNFIIKTDIVMAFSKKNEAGF